jgi:hypothetical protein
MSWKTPGIDGTRHLYSSFKAYDGRVPVRGSVLPVSVVRVLYYLVVPERSSQHLCCQSRRRSPEVSGTKAMGEVTVQIEEKGRKVMGRGASTDVIEASAKALLMG